MPADVPAPAAGRPRPHPPAGDARGGPDPVGTGLAPPGAAETGGSGPAPPGEPGRTRLAGAAALMAALTVVSRLAGFGRTYVFLHAVGPGLLGDAYVTANWLPNIIFEIVAGGALASLVVPLLAGAVARGDRRAVSATTSALLTWTLTLLTPLALLVVVAARPIIEMVADGFSTEQVSVGTDMLRIFAVQLPLYGVGIVLTGVLQAHRRFAWPVIAPLLSSLTVIVAYLAFAITQGAGADLPAVGPPGRLILAVGTTLGVVVLSLCLVVPLRRLRLRPRPTYRFDGEVRRRVGGLALAGAVTVAAQQIALLVMLRLANGGPTGTATLFNGVQPLYLLPWAVLAVPLATAAFPDLAAAHSAGDPRRFRRTAATAVRGVLLLSLLGAAVLAAVAVPAASVLVKPDSAPTFAAGIAAFAPGVVGYGLFAVLSRILYARADTARAAIGTVAGWGVAVGCAAALAAGLAEPRRLVSLGLATSIGMTVLGATLLAMVARRAGRPALAGVPRAAGVGLLAAAAAAVAGIAAGWLVTAPGVTPAAGPAVLQGMLSAVVVGLVFLGVAYALERRDVRPMVVNLGRRLRVTPGRHGTGEGRARHGE